MNSSSSEGPPRRPTRMRRRLSAINPPPRRRRHKRRAAWHTQSLARLAAAVGFVLLVLYEFFVLRGAFSARAVASVTGVRTTYTNSNISPKPPPVAVPVLQNEHEEVTVPEGGSTRERIESAAHVAVKRVEEDTADFKQPLKRVEEKDEEKEKEATALRREQDAAMLQKLESRAADEEDDGDAQPQQPTAPNVEGGGAVPKRPSVSPRDPKRVQKTSTDGDIEPPKPRTRSKPRDRGAEPGAGENFWQWFQETKGSEKGEVGSGLNCPADYERLCKMVFKYLRKYKVRALFDVGCSKNVEWIGNVLKKAGNELWGFKYYCGEPNSDQMAAAKQALAGLDFVEYVPDEWWREGFPEDTELLLAWDVLPHIAYGRIWKFFVKAKMQNVKYVLIDNYPGILNDPSPKRDYLNVRKHPFRFPAAKEVVQNVTEPGETAKRQLLFYESEMLPDNLQ